VRPVGFEPTNLTVSPDHSIDLASPSPAKNPVKRPVLDGNWTEILGWIETSVPDVFP